jgi:hypothetical protein
MAVGCGCLVDLVFICVFGNLEIAVLAIAQLAQ